MRENIKTDNKKIIKAASIILVVLVLTLFFAEKKTFASLAPFACFERCNAPFLPDDRHDSRVGRGSYLRK